MNKVFISYRIRDSHDLVSRLDADLSRVFGTQSVFRDKTRIGGGSEWGAELEKHALGCQVMLVVIGPGWQQARADPDDSSSSLRLTDPLDWVRREITLSLNAGNHVVPVLANHAAMPSRDLLGSCKLLRLLALQALELRSDDYEADLARIVRRLREYGLRRTWTAVHRRRLYSALGVAPCIAALVWGVVGTPDPLGTCRDLAAVESPFRGEVAGVLNQSQHFEALVVNQLDTACGLLRSDQDSALLLLRKADRELQGLLDLKTTDRLAVRKAHATLLALLEKVLRVRRYKGEADRVKQRIRDSQNEGRAEAAWDEVKGEEGFARDATDVCESSVRWLGVLDRALAVFSEFRGNSPAERCKSFAHDPVIAVDCLRVVQVLNGVTWAELRVGNLANAANASNEAFVYAEGAFGVGDRRVSTHLYTYAHLLNAQQEYDEVIRLYEMKERKVYLSPVDHHYLSHQKQLAVAKQQVGQQSNLLSVLAAMTKQPANVEGQGWRHWQYAYALMNAGRLEDAWAQLDLANKRFQEGCETERQYLCDENHYAHGSTRCLVGRVAQLMGRNELAREAFSGALESYLYEGRRFENCMEFVAGFFESRGRAQEAEIAKLAASQAGPPCPVQRRKNAHVEQLLQVLNRAAASL